MKGTKPSIVFCHGLWADGSCFSVATVRRTLGRVSSSSPAILVGHSYGGSVVERVPSDLELASVRTRA